MIPEPAIDRLSAMFRNPDVSGTRYELVSVLGRGGMGVVYLARDTALDREVALKIFDRPPGDANEAKLIARLEHPGIVPVHDFGELPDGRLFYAMKLVRGDRLDRWMAAGRDIGERLGVFLRVCETVAFAHAHGVIHRDLKPENVMVGEFGEVLVLDWGISTELRSADCGLRIADSDSGSRNADSSSGLRPSTLREPQGRPEQGRGATSSGRPEALEGRNADCGSHGGHPIAGTPDYMAPEQARGEPGVDHRADVFALGAVLAGMAADSAPVLAIARKAQSPDAVARYQSVPELAADVNRYLAGRAVRAHRERLLDRVTRVGRRYRLPILLVLTYIVVRALLLWLFRV